MFIYHRNDAEEKSYQKRGVADVYFHFQSVEMRLKTQGHCHQAAYISMLSRPVVALILLSHYRICTSRVVQVI